MMSTQTTYPWRASLRTGAVSLLVTLPVLGVIVPEMIDYALAEYGARWVVPAWLRMTLLAVSGVVSLAASLVNRALLYPQISGWLTRHGAGPTPSDYTPERSDA